MTHELIVQVRKKALMLLSKREYSRKKLAEKLGQKINLGPCLDKLLDDLEKDGILSDERYVNAFLSSRKGRYGHIKILYDLKNNGVQAVDLDRAKQILLRDELLRCRRVLHSKYGISISEDVKEIGKRSRFLMSRGFPRIVVEQLVRGKVSSNKL